MTFRDREDAGLQLAERLAQLELRDPVVLAIPRGGIVIGDVLARKLGAELDVVLSRKLRAPGQPELAIGAIGEDGGRYVDAQIRSLAGADDAYLERECRHQLEEIERRREFIRAVRPQAAVAHRSVIVTDDGLATGSTMIGALEVVRTRDPHEMIVAVAVGASERVSEIERRCDRVVCLLQPETFYAISEFFEDFTQVDDAQVIDVLRASVAGAPGVNA
jgi:predicted phosphoribosyltransferase